MRKYLFLILTIFSAILFSQSATSQTCRVNAGRSMAGMKSYIEVYEYDFVTEKPSFPGGDKNLLSYINSNRC